MKWHRLILLTLFLAIQPALSQTLSLPPRPADALSGSAFAKSIEKLDRTQREEKIMAEILRGNVPQFLRKLSSIHAQNVMGGETYSATYYVTPDYLAVGSDEDYFLTPLSPIVAQKVADALHCTLPTRKMVDDIYAAAEVKLVPSPIPPSPAMITVPVFIQHNQTIREQRKQALAAHPLGALVAGHKKDVVISNRIGEKLGRVAIYGWHKPDGKPIQPLSIVHQDTYADYSHGIRLVQLSMFVNGKTRDISVALCDTDLEGLLSDEGAIPDPRYPRGFYVPPATVIVDKPKHNENTESAP